VTTQTDREIIARFPTLFDTDGDFTTTAMGRGFENVGEGWLPVMTQLCERLVRLPQADFRIVCVKSKYADLRVIYRGGDDATDKAVAEARAAAARTCSMCGAAGERRMTPNGWWVVRCAVCAG
jgi:hypothetical protein